VSGITSSYGTVSTIPEFPLNARVIVATVGLYLCPANKKAKVTGMMILDAVGADATYALAVRRGGTFFPLDVFVVAGGVSRVNKEITMDATDLFTNIGDSGSTNGTTDMTAQVQEITV